MVKVFQIFLLNITGLNIKSDKGTATSSHSSKPSKKKASALSKSSYFTTGSSNALYLSVSERRKSVEHAKLVARQAEEHTQRQFKLLEQSFELERQKIEGEVLVARENATLVEHQNFLKECLPKEVKGRSQLQSSNGFNENLIHKWVNNSRPQYSLIESNSFVSESSNSSQLSGSNTSISEFLVNNSPSRTHNKKVKYTSQRQSSKIKTHVKYPPTNNSMNLNVAEVKSFNHHPPRQKDSSNINDALHNLSLDINQNSVKNKSDCSIDMKSKILDNYIHKPDLNNDKSHDITTREPVDKFIDDLVEGIETPLSQSNLNLSICLALKQEYECCQLPPIELGWSRGNPTEWPQFISNFRNRIHKKVSFNDSMRLKRLLSALEGEAKKSVELVGCEGIFDATELKSLKQDFGNPLVVSHLKIKTIFDQPQIIPIIKLDC